MGMLCITKKPQLGKSNQSGVVYQENPVERIVNGLIKGIVRQRNLDKGNVYWEILDKSISG